MKMFNEDDFVMLRKAIGTGITDAIAFVLIVYLFSIGVGYLYGLIFADYDNTDDKQNGVRSGVELVIDHGTGCQYLQSQLGYLTPRMDKEGKQVCAKR